MSAHTFRTLLSKIGFIDLYSSQWYPIGSNLSKTVCATQVRYRVPPKPRWVPKAESKIYKITTRRRLPPREHAENLRLYQHHKCFMRLTYEHCKNENLRISDTGEITAKIIEQEEREHREMMEYNKNENDRMARQREQRIEEEKEQLLQEILEFKAQEAEREKVMREEALKELEETEKLVITFVDPERLEAAIEYAIDNPTDYNFAMDLEGRVYKGRNTAPHLVDKNTLQILDVKDDGFVIKTLS